LGIGHLSLPGSLPDSWYLAFIGKFSEADPAKVKISHVATFATTTETTPNDSWGELWLLFWSCDYWCLCHKKFRIHADQCLFVGSDTRFPLRRAQGEPSRGPTCTVPV